VANSINRLASAEAYGTDTYSSSTVALIATSSALTGDTSASQTTVSTNRDRDLQHSLISSSDQPSAEI